MGCCGETVGGRLTVTQKQIDEGLRLKIEYGGGPAVHVVGPVTAATYTFSGLQRVAYVDPRDGPAILRDRRFRLKGVVRRSPEEVSPG